MAERHVYVPGTNGKSIKQVLVSFDWNKGFAVSQKQKNIAAIHGAFRRRFPDRNVLDISSKSLQPLGVELSAFHLKKYVPELDAKVPVECVFQGGKAFVAGGPYMDLYTASPKDAKRDPRLKNSGELKCFCFNGKKMPLIPQTTFYDWLYINALLENPELAEKLLEYDAFTDIEFNPNKSLNCQAKAAALFVGLAKNGLLEKCRDFEEFLSLLKP